MYPTLCITYPKVNQFLRIRIQYESGHIRAISKSDTLYLQYLYCVVSVRHRVEYQQIILNQVE